jgi:hypothetical protein
MARSPDSRPSYFDPQLWMRLEPRLREMLAIAQEDFFVRALPPDQYLVAFTRVRTLREVLELADELTRVEDH